MCRVARWAVVLSVMATLLFELCPFSESRRESTYDRRMRGRYRVEIGMNESSTEEPIELSPPGMDLVDSLCKHCPQCFQCRNGQPLAVNAKMPKLLNNSDLIVVYSMDGEDAKQGFVDYLENSIENDFWRLGLKPLKLWTEACILFLSFMSGTYPLCNCKSRPETYQIFMNDIDKLFKNSTTEYPCSNSKRTCVVSFNPDLLTGYYLVDNRSDAILRPDGENAELSFLQAPSFRLKISLETLKADNWSETFFAVSRHELIMLVRDIASHHKKLNHHFTDLEMYLISKIQGKKEYCLPFGRSPRVSRTFDEFLSINKTR